MDGLDWWRGIGGEGDVSGGNGSVRECPSSSNGPPSARDEESAVSFRLMRRWPLDVCGNDARGPSD